MSNRYDPLYAAHKDVAAHFRGGVTGISHDMGRSEKITSNMLHENGNKLNVEVSQDMQDRDPEHRILTTMAARQGLMLVQIPSFDGDVTTDNLMASANHLSACMGQVSQAVIEAKDPSGDGGAAVTATEKQHILDACEQLLHKVLQIKIDLKSK